MTRTTRTDVDKLMDTGLFMPTKTLILFGEVDEVFAEYAIKGLTALDSTRRDEPINILLNSPGGDVTQGLAVYNYVQACRSEVHITVVGEAESMAAWILQAADVRRAYADATIMIHVGEFGLDSNHPENQRARIAHFDRQSERLEQILVDRMDVPILEVYNKLQFDRIYSAREALAIRLIDEVVE